MRAAALKRNGEAMLNRIEKMETKAIKQYEMKLQSILRAVNTVTAVGFDGPPLDTSVEYVRVFFRHERSR